MGGVHNYSDTSYISPRDMSQQSDFLSNKGNFPSKPRDQYQFGVFVGYPYVDGDCPTALKGVGNGPQSYSYGFGVHVRKAMGYVFSVRTSLAYYNMVGLDYQPNGNLNNSPKILQLYANAPKGYVHNFRTMAFVPSIEGLVSLSNIMFHTKQKRWNIYGLFGYSALLYNTKMNLMDINASRYLYENITQFYNQGWTRQQLRRELRNIGDDSYETTAEVNDRRQKIGIFNLRHCFTSGFGLEYRMGKSWSLGLEYKRIQTRDDYVDGWFRQSGDLRYAVFTSEWDNLAFGQIGANFNMGNSRKRVPPLWWLNPLEFAYADLKDSKVKIAGLFKVKDDDKDGVMNELDLEPNTPDGCPVDTHGVTADTDGDGVPDCKDKEKLTLQKCFPVDADGVGKCPDPECCKNIVAGPAGTTTTTCPSDYPSLSFKGNVQSLSNDTRAMLASVASKMKANPTCNISVTGYPEASKAAQAVCNKRNEAIKMYLVEKEGISADRISTNCEVSDGANKNTVDIKSN